jgi:hypothetical protein
MERQHSHLEVTVRVYAVLDIHIFGHSHVNLRSLKDGTIYLNNAFGYPHETRRTAKALVCVLEV